MTKKNTELLDEFEAAEFLKMSVHWLRASRLRVPKWPGPMYLKHDGWHIAYRKKDLIKFQEQRRNQGHTVDPAARFKMAGKGAR